MVTNEHGEDKKEIREEERECVQTTIPLQIFLLWIVNTLDWYFRSVSVSFLSSLREIFSPCSVSVQFALRF